MIFFTQESGRWPGDENHLATGSAKGNRGKRHRRAYNRKRIAVALQGDRMLSPVG